MFLKSESDGRGDRRIFLRGLHTYALCNPPLQQRRAECFARPKTADWRFLLASNLIRNASNHNLSLIKVPAGYTHHHKPIVHVALFVPDTIMNDKHRISVLFRSLREVLAGPGGRRRRRSSWQADALESRCLLSAGNPAPWVNHIWGSTSIQGSPAIFIVSFSEVVNGVDAADFAVERFSGDVTWQSLAVTGSGATWQVEVQGLQGRGALRVNLLPNSDIRDLSGQPLYRPGNAQYHAQPTYVETEAAPLPLRQPEVMTGDFDGDGREEVIMTGSGSDHRRKLKVIELDNSGAVQVRRPSLDLGYSEPTVIDIDQNGTDELLLFRGSQIQAVRIDSNGQPTIVADSTYYADNYYGLNVPDQTNFSDMNGDGRMDFVHLLFHVESGQTHVGVATGDGTGRFLFSTAIASTGSDIRCRPADINGDGRQDLLISEDDYVRPGVAYRRIQVLLQNAAGQFVPTFSTTARADIDDLITDINADGKVDLVSSYYPSAYPGFVTILPGQGDGTFAQEIALPVPNSGWLVQTDGNGDGRADVLLLSKSVSATAALSLLTQDTSGQLSETAVLSLPDSILDDFFRFQTWGTPSLLAATAGGFEFRVSEFDQSGSTAGVLKRARLNGDLSWSVETLIRQPGVPNTMLAADFDGDGQKDELFLGSELPETSGNTDLHIFLRNPPGSGLSAVKQKISFADPSGPTPGRAVAMNLNNDGIADIVHTIPENSAIGIRLSIEPGVYAETQQIPVGVDPDDLVSADFNGDGREDLAVSVSGENRIALYLTQPDGSLLRQTDLLTAAEPRGMAAVNIAGDASADLVVAEPGASRVSIYGGLNNGSFVSALQIPLDSPAERVAIGDVNADGFPDIIAACSLDDSLRIVRGQLGGFAAAVRQPLPGSPTAIAAVITSDGNTVDLYAGLAEVPNIASARTVRLSGDSNGTFGDPQVFNIGGVQGNFSTGDINGDGWVDLAFASVYGGGAVVCTVDKSTPDVYKREIIIGHSISSLIIADANADGRPDLVAIESQKAPTRVLLNADDGSMEGGNFTRVNCQLPTMDPVGDVVIPEGTTEYRINLTGISAGDGESEPLKIAVNASHNSGIPLPAPTPQYVPGSSNGALIVRPPAFGSSVTTVSIFIEDGGPDNDVQTWQDNSFFVRTLMIYVKPTRAIVQTPVGTIQSQRPLISWSGLWETDTKWRLWITNKTSGRNPLIDEITTNTNFTPTVDLGLGVVEVFLQGITADGQRLPWSKVHRFEINTAPLVSPIGSRITSGTPVFTWSDVPGATAWEVFLSNTSTGQNPLIREVVTQRTWTPPQPLGISAWQFWARALVGDKYAGAWSPPVSFAVATAPTPLGPTISTVSQRPQFTCSAVPGATRYGFYVQNLVTGQVVANVSGLSQPAWTPATAIPFGAYRWWAIAETATGIRSNWSAAVDLTIGDRPVLLSPRGNTSSTALAARWLPIRNATY